MEYKIKHECGIAFLRLRKPLQYFIDKYQSSTYAVNKMFLKGLRPFSSVLLMYLYIWLKIIMMAKTKSLHY